LTDVQANNDLHVSIDADLGITGIIEAAFLAHDAGLGIGKADLFFVFDVLTGIKLFFAFLKGLL
jgi:hypothetical protein